LLPDLATLLNRPLAIGARTIANRLVFAPMTFLGHVAFRELLDRFGGCGLFFSEMCSARTVPTEKPSVSRHFRWRAAELPHLACQIMGCEPAEMAAAANTFAPKVLIPMHWGDIVGSKADAEAVKKAFAGTTVIKMPERR
jgi:hypothetical protein